MQTSKVSQQHRNWHGLSSLAVSNAGILSSQRSLIVVYFTYNAAHMVGHWRLGMRGSPLPSSLTLSSFLPLLETQVITFHFFVDLCTDTSIKGEPGKLIAYERAATALIFFSFLLSIAATVGGLTSLVSLVLW